MPKRSVHIRNENVEIWESLDSPSESVNNMLTDIRNSRPTGDKERKIVRLREKLAQARVGIENYNQRIIEIENECETIERDLQNALDADYNDYCSQLCVATRGAASPAEHRLAHMQWRYNQVKQQILS